MPMLMPDGDEVIERVSRAHIDLKPGDAEDLGTLEPGTGVRIVLVGELQSTSKSKLEDGKEYDGSMSITVKELKIEKRKNAFMELAEDD